LPGRLLVADRCCRACFRTLLCPHADLFSGVGRKWLFAQDLPADEWRSVEALLRQLDFHGDELGDVERDIAIDAIDDSVVARLMSAPEPAS
jgi:transposase